MLDYNLSERAVLMRLSIGLPGEARQDPDLTGQIQGEKALGVHSGKWVKNLFPSEALAAVKKLDNEARQYHAAVTLPFDAGIGILPAALIMEHGDRMRQFKGMRENLIETQFLADPQKWVDWAVKEQNGTFDPDNYPGCSKDAAGQYVVEVEEFRTAMRKKFHFETQPLPVPDAKHFEETVSSLLGVDTESVNLRVKDAAIEAQKELMRRLLEPVTAMARKLAEQPKQKKSGGMAEDIVFRDTLVGNIADVVRIAPKLNLSGDTVIDAAIKEIETLAKYSPKTLREDKSVRAEAQRKAQAVVDKLSGYKL